MFANFLVISKMIFISIFIAQFKSIILKTIQEKTSILFFLFLHPTQQSIKDTWFLFSTRSLFSFEFLNAGRQKERGGRCVLNILCVPLLLLLRFFLHRIEFREFLNAISKKCSKNNFSSLPDLILKNCARCLFFSLKKRFNEIFN